MTIYRNTDGDLWDTAPAADLTADELRTILAETGYTLARHVGEPGGAWAAICVAGCCGEYEELTADGQLVSSTDPPPPSVPWGNG